VVCGVFKGGRRDSFEARIRAGLARVGVTGIGAIVPVLDCQN